MTPNDDPGWPHGPSMFVFLIPGAVPWYLRRRGTGDGLLVLRQVFISFPVALVLVGIALAPIRLQGGSLVPWLPILIALAIVSLVGERVIEKPLDCATDATLAGTYRTRFFLRIAFADAVALYGFCFAFIGAPKWIYYAAAGMTLVRLWTGVAPTRSALARDQDILNRSGCGRTLVAALRTAAPPPSRRDQRSSA